MGPLQEGAAASSGPSSFAQSAARSAQSDSPAAPDYSGTLS